VHQRQLILPVQELLPARYKLVGRRRHTPCVAVCAEPVAVWHCLEARYEAAQVEAAQAGAALQDCVATPAIAGAAHLVVLECVKGMHAQSQQHSAAVGGSVGIVSYIDETYCLQDTHGWPGDHVLEYICCKMHACAHSPTTGSKTLAAACVAVFACAGRALSSRDITQPTGSRLIPRMPPLHRLRDHSRPALGIRHRLGQTPRHLLPHSAAQHQQQPCY
jgi:hypothetical protein